LSSCSSFYPLFTLFILPPCLCFLNPAHAYFTSLPYFKSSAYVYTGLDLVLSEGTPFWCNNLAGDVTLLTLSLSFIEFLNIFCFNNSCVVTRISSYLYTVLLRYQKYHIYSKNDKLTLWRLTTYI
jgi:hypothetical protein